MMKSVAPPPPFSLSQTLEKKKKNKIYKIFSKDFFLFPFFSYLEDRRRNPKRVPSSPGGSKDPGNAHHSSVHSDDFFFLSLFLFFKHSASSFFSFSLTQLIPHLSSSIHFAHPNNLVFLFPPQTWLSNGEITGVNRGQQPRGRCNTPVISNVKRLSRNWKVDKKMKKKKKIFVDSRVVTSFLRGDEVRRYAETIKAKMVTLLLFPTEFSGVHKNQLTTTPVWA